MEELINELGTLIRYLADIAETVGQAFDGVASAFTFLPASIVSALLGVVGFVIMFRVIK